MTICAISTTNPTAVEAGIQFWVPQDGNYIPSGFENVTFTLDAEDLADDYYATVSDAASAWCSSKGFTFCQLIEEY